jgi:hypothetical protein
VARSSHTARVMLRAMKWILGPMILGMLAGAALQGGSAHACECYSPYWSLSRVSVESTDPAVDDSALWGVDGMLFSRRLSVWQENHTLNLEF